MNLLLHTAPLLSQKRSLRRGYDDDANDEEAKLECSNVDGTLKTRPTLSPSLLIFLPLSLLCAAFKSSEGTFPTEAAKLIFLSVFSPPLGHSHFCSLTLSPSF
jgi:hypothetical protein